MRAWIFFIDFTGIDCWGRHDDIHLICAINQGVKGFSYETIIGWLLSNNLYKLQHIAQYINDILRN